MKYVNYFKTNQNRLKVGTSLLMPISSIQTLTQFTDMRPVHTRPNYHWPTAIVGRFLPANPVGSRIVNMFNVGRRLIIIKSLLELAASGLEPDESNAGSSTDLAKISLWVWAYTLNIFLGANGSDLHIMILPIPRTIGPYPQTDLHRVWRRIGSIGGRISQFYCRTG